MVVLGVLAGLAGLAGCGGAEQATAAELCASVHQLHVSATTLAPQLAAVDEAGRRTLSYSLAEDVESAREISARQAAGRRETASPAIGAGDAAVVALRTPGSADWPGALTRLAATSAAVTGALGCAAAAPSG
ncbi:hypothetical protein CLV35_1754 [Motilibacter peucedani]|uniref:Uncharacterized protein n=1 Tax=Motilibacter peucedani TaxID=598650 RepID=A0A420XPX3_9ACTN|nr:hypothetical protein CLV35_1754 [Motilibacter peucedani]